MSRYTLREHPGQSDQDSSCSSAVAAAQALLGGRDIKPLPGESTNWDAILELLRGPHGPEIARLVRIHSPVGDREAEKHRKNRSMPGLLHCAAVDGRADVAELLIGKLGIAPDGTVRTTSPSTRRARAKRMENMATPIILAAFCGHDNVVRVLLKAGADPRRRAIPKPWRDVGITLLHIACMAPRVTATLLELDTVDVNAKATVAEWTPLHFAAMEGSVACITALLKAGADLEARGRAGSTALHCATRFGELDAVKCLVRAGANCMAQNIGGVVPLFVACDAGYTDVTQYLLAKCEDVNQYLSPRRNRALHYLAFSGHDNLMRKFLKSPHLEIDARNYRHETPLHRACFQGQVETAKTLLRAGADIHATDKYGWNALLFATAHGSPELTKFLLSEGASVESVDRRGFNAAHSLMVNNTMVAETQSRVATLKVLHQSGCPLNRHCHRGRWTPALLAAGSNARPLLRKLLKLHPECIHDTSYDGSNMLHMAALFGCSRVVPIVVSAGLDVNTVSKRGYTPAHVACCFRNMHVLYELVAAGADLSLRTKKSRSSVLHLASRPYEDACGRGDSVLLRLRTAEYLLKLGADVEQRDRRGLTPLAYAARYGQLKLVQWFVRTRGANYQAVDKKNRSPLWWASCRGHLEVVQFLVELGAKVDREVVSAAARSNCADTMEFVIKVSSPVLVSVRTINGQLPIHVAAECGAVQSASVLLKYLPDLERLDGNMQSPVAIAEDKGRHDFVQFCLEHGAKRETTIDPTDGNRVAPRDSATSKRTHATRTRTVPTNDTSMDEQDSDSELEGLIASLESDEVTRDLRSRSQPREIEPSDSQPRTEKSKQQQWKSWDARLFCGPVLAGMTAYGMLTSCEKDVKPL